MNNPYEEFNITKNATRDQIKKAYRNLSKLYHPDINKNKDTSKFRDIQQAYDILQDEEKRKHFDETGLLPDEQEENTIKGKTRENLYNLVKQILNDKNFIQRYNNIDFINTILNIINSNRITIEENKKSVTEYCETMKLILDRFNHKGESNDFIKEIIEVSIKENAEQVQSMEIELKVLILMKELIKEYDYDFEKIIDTSYTTTTINYTGWR